MGELLYGRYPSREALIENLRDAGCNDKQINEFLVCLEQAQTTRQLSMLNRHRQCLLDNLHKEEQCIDCLDYLLYHIQRTQGGAEAKSETRPAKRSGDG